MAVYKRAAQLLEAALDDELVGLEPVGGTCFGFNEVAARVWQLLAEPKSFHQLKASLEEEYDVAPEVCDTQLAELLTDLIENKLVSEC